LARGLRPWRSPPTGAPCTSPARPALLDRALAPGGYLGLTCFAAGQIGCELPDDQLYRDGQLHGGLAYTPQALRRIFAGYEQIELRPMNPQPDDGAAFGVPFLLTALFQRPVQ